MQPPALPSRYDYRQLLGAGGMGQVHLVHDRERGEDVALKLLASQPGADAEEARLLFKQEFWTLASLRHPNLVAGHDYGETADGTPYFTMEYVPGRDLAPGAPMPEAEVRGWLPGVASALGYLHACGYVHGDLKPENVRVREDGAVKLMDLGLLARSGGAGGPIRGSLAYMAPETIQQGVVDGRADLYALGAVLYHLLTGVPPFAGDDPVAILRAHLAKPPEHPRELRPNLSPALSGAVARLLSKDPASRFGRASALLDALGLQGPDAAPAGLLGSPVIGRSVQQADLAALVAQPRAATRWLVGEAGSGKSRLLQAARAEAQLAGLPVLAVHGQGVDAPPYEALVPLLRSLVDGAPAALMERLTPILAKLLPDLGQDAAAPLDGTQERVRIQIAVSELAGDRHRQALWPIDDWDQLDPASRDLLAFLRRQGWDRPWRWVITTTDAPADEPTLALPPLEDADVLAVTEALLGQETLPDAVTERIPAMSGAQPGGIRMVLEHWLRVEALRWNRDAWVAGPTHAFDVPGGPQVARDAAFEALPAETRRVARAAAVLGQEGELRGLAAMLDGDVPFDALRSLEDAGVLATAATTFRFQRPARAAMLLAGSDPAERRDLHARAAAWLARRLGNDPQAPSLPLGGLLEAARHHLEGEVPGALPWVLAAARRALAMYELTTAQALVTRALARQDLTEADRLQLRVYEANALRHLGRTDDAIAYYAQHDLIDRLERADHPAFLDELVTLGALKTIKSDYAGARPVLSRAIELADARGDRWASARARMFAGRVLFFAGEADAAREVMAEGTVMARGEGVPGGLLASMLSFYGYVLATSDAAQQEEGLELLNEAIELNRRLGNVVTTNEVLSLQGNVLLSLNRFEEARQAFQTGLDNSRRYGIDIDQMPARANLGAIALELGDLVTARTEASLAGQLATLQGRKFMQGFALALEGSALAIEGSPAAGVDLVERGLGLAREIGNRYLELHVLAYYVPVLASLGRFDEALDALALARQIARETQNKEFDPRFERFETQVAVTAAMATAEPDRARQAEVADRIARLVRRAHAANDDVELAHAQRWEATWQLFRELPKVAAVTADEALDLARSHGLRGLEAELERLQGRIALANGLPSAACEHFEASLELAQELGNRPLEILNEHSLGLANHDVAKQRDAAQALYALGADLPMKQREAYDRLPDRAAVLAEDTAAGQALEDRVTAVLDLMGALTADGPVDLDGVLELAVRAMVKIADADRGFLLLYDGVTVSREVFYGMSPSESAVYSRGFADQVFFGREPVIMEDVQSDFHLGHQQSVQSLGLRGVVGVPLVAGDQAIGVIIADCKRVNVSFGTEQQDVVLALARQVAHAIVVARRQADQSRSLARYEVLHELAIATIGRAAVEDFMAPIASKALNLSGARRAYLLAGSPLTCLGAFGTDGLPLPPSTQGPTMEACQEALANGRPLARTAPEPLHAVPVTHRGRTLGVLALEGQGPARPSPDLDALLAAVAELVGAFLANRELALRATPG